jgi:hypothetical protein
MFHHPCLLYVCVEKLYKKRRITYLYSLYLLSLFLVLVSLAPLVKKVSEDRVVEMTNKLCDKLLNGKDQHRDTASIALKTIIVEVTTPSLAEKILVSLAPQLISGVTSVSFFISFPVSETSP